MLRPRGRSKDHFLFSQRSWHVIFLVVSHLFHTLETVHKQQADLVIIASHYT